MAKLKNGVQPDEFCDDGVTKRLNKSRPYGTVYSAMLDEWKGKPMPVEETAYVQDNIPYKGDGVPVGYVPATLRGVPVIEPQVEEVIAENEALKRQITDLARRLALLENAEKPSTTLSLPKKGAEHAPGARSA